MTCVIVNYNAIDSLADCVTSVLDTPSINEVIIVDNASVDSSIVEIKSRFSGSSEIHIIKNHVNSGFSVACNQAVTTAINDYYLFLNPDCILGREAVDFLLLAVRKYSGIAGPLLLNADGSEQPGSRRNFPDPWNSLQRILRFGDGFDLHSKPISSSIEPVDAISGACMLMSQEVYEDIGGFDEGYFLHCEDLDLCMRSHEKGWKVLFVPDAKVTHYAGTCSKNRYLFVEWNKHKGMLRFYRKFYRKKYPLLLYWLVSVGVWGRYGLLAARHGVRQLFVHSGNSNG